MTDPDHMLDAITESMTTLGAENLLLQSMEAQTQRTVEGLLVEYRSGTLTTDKLWAFVGALDQTDRIRHRFERTMKRGLQAAKQMTGDANG